MKKKWKRMGNDHQRQNKYYLLEDYILQDMIIKNVSEEDVRRSLGMRRYVPSTAEKICDTIALPEITTNKRDDVTAK